MSLTSRYPGLSYVPAFLHPEKTLKLPVTSKEINIITALASCFQSREIKFYFPLAEVHYSSWDDMMCFVASDKLTF